MQSIAQTNMQLNCGTTVIWDCSCQKCIWIQKDYINPWGRGKHSKCCQTLKRISGSGRPQTAGCYKLTKEAIIVSLSFSHHETEKQTSWPFCRTLVITFTLVSQRECSNISNLKIHETSVYCPDARYSNLFGL